MSVPASLSRSECRLNNFVGRSCHSDAELLQPTVRGTKHFVSHQELLSEIDNRIEQLAGDPRLTVFHKNEPRSGVRVDSGSFSHNLEQCHAHKVEICAVRKAESVAPKHRFTLRTII